MISRAWSWRTCGAQTDDLEGVVDRLLSALDQVEASSTAGGSASVTKCNSCTARVMAT